MNTRFWFLVDIMLTSKKYSTITKVSYFKESFDSENKSQKLVSKTFEVYCINWSVKQKYNSAWILLLSISVLQKAFLFLLYRRILEFNNLHKCKSIKHSSFLFITIHRLHSNIWILHANQQVKKTISRTWRSEVIFYHFLYPISWD